LSSRRVLIGSDSTTAAARDMTPKAPTIAQLLSTNPKMFKYHMYITDAMKPDVNIAMLPAYDFPGL